MDKKENMPKKRIWVSLPLEVVTWLDSEIESKRFKDYSHAVDYVVSDFIKREIEGRRRKK